MGLSKRLTLCKWTHAVKVPSCTSLFASFLLFNLSVHIEKFKRIKGKASFTHILATIRADVVGGLLICSRPILSTVTEDNAFDNVFSGSKFFVILFETKVRLQIPRLEA